MHNVLPYVGTINKRAVLFRLHAYVRLESIAILGIVPTYGYKYDLYNYIVYILLMHIHCMVNTLY